MLLVNSLTISLFIVSFYNFLVLSSIRTNQNSCAHADIGPVQPVVRLRVPTATRAREDVGRAILSDFDVAETLSALQDQVEGLTLGIPDVSVRILYITEQWNT